MKRQPIVSAAVFFVLLFGLVESDGGEGNPVGTYDTPTDCIFPLYTLY